jgi:hypothetical protein
MRTTELLATKRHKENWGRDGTCVAPIGAQEVLAGAPTTFRVFCGKKERWTAAQQGAAISFNNGK